jgi:hypothetical protein
VLLTVYTIYYFFSVLKVEFIVVDGVMEINFYKGNKLIRKTKVDKYEFTIVAAHSIYFRDASRILLELNVKSKTGCYVLTEDFDNNNPGIKIKASSGMYIENYFCRTPGTLSQLLKRIESEEAPPAL